MSVLRVDLDVRGVHVAEGSRVCGCSNITGGAALLKLHEGPSQLEKLHRWRSCTVALPELLSGATPSHLCCAVRIYHVLSCMQHATPQMPAAVLSAMLGHTLCEIAQHAKVHQRTTWSHLKSAVVAQFQAGANIVPSRRVGQEQQFKAVIRGGYHRVIACCK
jgi:hypothetical protein